MIAVNMKQIIMIVPDSLIASAAIFLSVSTSERTGYLSEPQRTRLKMGAEATRAVIIQKSIVYKLGSRPRSISTGQLHMLPYFHIQPIYLVVYQGP